MALTWKSLAPEAPLTQRLMSGEISRPNLSDAQVSDRGL